MPEGMLGTLPLSEIRGPRNDLDEKLAGPNGRRWLREFNRFLRQEPTWQTPAALEVVSDGRSGTDFIRTLKAANWRISDWAQDVMKKPAFTATNSTRYKLVVIKGDEFDHDPTTDEIRALASERNYLTPPAEVAPLLREFLSDKDLETMGVFWLAVMHEPIIDSDGRPGVLFVNRDHDGRWLSAYWANPNDPWSRYGGWVFLAPQAR